MAVSYKKLFKILIDRDMKKKEFRDFVGISYSTMSKLEKGENGKVDYDDNSGKWYYKNQSNQKFSIGATAEGVKKISIMDRLLGNGYVNKESVLFIDELESALHPNAICDFLDTRPGTSSPSWTT